MTEHVRMQFGLYPAERLYGFQIDVDLLIGYDGDMTVVFPVNINPER